MAARKTVTVVFCDIVDSTPLGERIDPEVHRRIQERYFDAVRRALERHGGTVEKFIGDAAMAVFGIPVAHDDDALRAIRAAVDLRPALSELNETLDRDFGVTISIRTGVNTGEVVAGDPSEGQAFATGDAVVTAQRLEASARAGEILIGDSTYRLAANAALVEPVEPLQLKGKANLVPAWRLLGVVEGAPPFPRRLDTPMVGRESELAALQAELQTAVAERRCRLATVVGPAGIGKSRLGNELLRTTNEEVTALVGSCLPYGEGVTYWPLRGIVLGGVGHLSAERLAERLEGAEDGARIAALLADAVGAGETPSASEDTFWAIRRFFEHLARERPLVVGFDELQWAEPTLLDLIEYLVGWTTDAPILLLGLGRPELAERRPKWEITVSLGPLSSADTEELADALGVEPEKRSRITAAAEGNPLFLEQLLALDEEGREEAIPPSIHAILAARLDRLDPTERATLEQASVVGREFTRGAVSALSGQPVGTTLLSLVRRDLIEPDRSTLQGEDGFRFRHVLIRDAAYLGLAKETRADLHVRYAHWLGSAGELDELVGYHLERAYRYLTELGSSDPELATAAGERLAASGERAAARGDLSAATNLLGRAVDLLPSDDPTRVRVQPVLAGALIRSGDIGRAQELFAETLEAARRLGDRRAELRARLELAFCRAFTQPEGSSEEIERVTNEVIPPLEELGDDAGLAKAWRLRSDRFVNACRWGDRAEALRRALVHAERAGDATEVAATAWALAIALYYGPMPVPEAIGECERLIRENPTNRSLEASISGTLAGLRAMRGEIEEARRLLEESRAIHEELGQRFRRAAGTALFAADVASLSGRPHEAVSLLRWGTETLREMGVASAMSTDAANLADALCAVGELAEAEEYAALSEENAAEDDVFSQVVWRIARAKVLAGQGEDARALELAREASARAETSDSPDLKARAALALAEVSGDRSLVERAKEFYRAKGNTVAADRLSAYAGSS
jgi:class 3 adenylate cyclase/tetratricopeptide (TPR) repeat protein